jgi:hypothetical protein
MHNCTNVAKIYFGPWWLNQLNPPRNTMHFHPLKIGDYMVGNERIATTTYGSFLLNLHPKKHKNKLHTYLQTM